MDAFDKYYLFDHDGNKMFSVTPHFKDGRHLVVGIKETIVFKKQAENVNKYLSKGSLAGVDGRLQTRNY
ncbi:hypothetical protein W261_02744, partial [Staphylococcus aureus DAR1956]